MWGIIAAVGIEIGLYIYHRYVEDHPTAPRPPTLQLPQSSIGTAVPMIYGTCRVRTPVLVWYGNSLAPGQNYTLVSDGSHVTADHYSVDMLFLLGIPFDGGTGTNITKLNGMWVGDTPASTFFYNPTTISFHGGNITPTTSDICIDGLFFEGSPGADLGGAGLIGPHTGGSAFTGAGGSREFVWNDGVQYSTTGAANTSFFSALSQNGDNHNLVPGYRRQTMAFCHCAIGLSPEMPALSFEVVSLSTGSASDMGQSLTDDADPAAVIYDLLTSKWGKLALPASSIELSTFQAASLTLFNEGNGYSRCIEQSEDAWSIIGDILKQIDGVLYPEPTTGKFELHLIRNDYSIPGLVDINPNNAQIESYAVQGWSETLNQVRLEWTNRINGYQYDISFGQNGPNAISQGNKVRSVTIRYQGVNNTALAQKLASRELAVVSRPVVKATVIVNRAFYQARPGSVYTLTWPELNVGGMVMRVARVDLGALHSGQITLDLIRDVFDNSLGAFPR